MKDSEKSSFLFSVLALILSLAGFFISFILELREVDSSVASGVCKIGASFDCGAVTNSAYAKLFGIHLSQYGLFFYLFLFSLSLLIFLNFKKKNEASILISFLSLGAVLFSVYLFIVSKFILSALCPFCIGLYAVNLLLFANSLKHFSGFSFLSSLNKILDLSFLIIAIASILVSIFINDVIHANETTSDALVQNTKDWSKSGTLDKSLRLNDGLNKDHVLGDKSARIEIVKFSDLQCVFCRKISHALDELVKNHGKDIKLIFKNYPIDPACNSGIPKGGHNAACYSAEALRCVGEQDGFWPFLTDLYNLEALENSSYSLTTIKAAIKARVKILGYDVDAFIECMDSHRQLKAIKDDILAGEKLKINSTPSIFINGKLVKTPTGKVLFEIVESLLQG